jgi:penicillin-binding protein 2
MADVVNPGGTAALSHLQNIDFAGKTGSAQTISNALKAKLGAAGKANFKDNGWFVGVEPRRNPEIVVCTLLEEGEHGYLAARTAAKVIKAFVEKEQRAPAKMAGTRKAGARVEVGAVWTTPDNDHDGDRGGDRDDKDKLQAGHFFVDLAKKPLAMAAASTQYPVPSAAKLR